MVLQSEEVIKIIEAGLDPRIDAARKQSQKLNMHMTGKNLIEFLETLDDYETTAQKKLREKLAKSNRSLFSFILRPMDKIFTAKGGSIQYNLTDRTLDEFKKQISSVADGLDIKRYLKKVVRKHYIIDPNAVLFIDIDKEGKLETHVVNTEKLFWYSNKGNKVNAIIFAPYKVEEPQRDRDKEFYRVIDQQTDRIFVRDGGGNVYEKESERLNNYFKFVPAMILGDEKNVNKDIFESFIEDILEDADEHLRDISVKTIHKLAHAYPRYWSYEQACVRCQGEGTIKTIENEVVKETTCKSCDGDGIKHRTNPSDELVLRAPMEGDPVLAPDVAGYVSPDLATAEFYEKNLERAKNSMFQATWGTTYEQGGKRETATGRFLDSQPVQDRLKDTSYTFSNFHQFMLNCYGKVILQDPNYEAAVSYGTRYILEGPDDILETYMNASRENISELGIIGLRNKWIESEYQSDTVELMKYKKLAKVEPFPTLKVSDVSGMPIPDQDKLRKFYFSTWVNTLKDAEIILRSEEELRAKLDEFVASKQLKEPEPAQTQPRFNQN